MDYMKGKKFTFLGVVFLILFAAIVVGCDSGSGGTPESKETVWELVWSDEFDGDTIDNTIWGYDIGTGNNGWGNSELQYFTDSSKNAYIEDGSLIITALKESIFAGSDYTSARLSTAALQSVRYGKVSARIKLPYGQGIWPAFWMLGNNYETQDWPFCGEIDIMEMVGGQGDNTVYGTIHWFEESSIAKKSSGKSFRCSSGIFADDFHEFSIEWTPESITWLIDGAEYYSVDITPETMKEFTRSFYVILNIAVGGNWPGSPDETTVFPQKMYVDYVRVYKDSALNAKPETKITASEKPLSIFYDPAISDGFPVFLNGDIIRFGGTNLPVISLSDIAADGDSSVSAKFPGGNWGGVYFQLAAATDMSAFAGGSLSFLVHVPDSIDKFEIKMESSGGSTSLFSPSYVPTIYDANFMQYTIPLSDFVDVDLAALKVPFSVWNPQKDGVSASGEILIDGIKFIK